MNVRVLLVEDVDELRATLRQALRLRGGFDIVAEAAEGIAGVTAAAEHQPDLVVLDLGLPGLTGTELVASMREAAPAAKIVVYTGSVTADRVDVVSRVDGFVRKEVDLRYLIDLLSDLSRRQHETAEIQLGPRRDDVALARRFLTEHCSRWGCTPAVDDALLVVSELVTNALVHGSATCRLRARFSAGVLRLEVSDHGQGAPDVQAAGADDEGGRGLLMVSLLAQSWGVELITTGGKIVWAELVVAAHDDPGLQTLTTGQTATEQQRPSSAPADDGTRGDDDRRWDDEADRNDRAAVAALR